MKCYMQVGNSGTLPKRSILCFVAMTGEQRPKIHVERLFNTSYRDKDK